MAEAYGCVVENRFYGLLDDETDPLDFLHQVTEKSSRKKKVTAAKKNDGKKESQKDRKAQVAAMNTEVQTKQSAPKQATKPPQKAYSSEKVNRPRPEQKTVFDDWYHGVVENPTEYDLEYRRMETVDKEKLVKNWLTSKGGGRGRGGFPRNTDNENQRGKREYDRHSGSDRGGIKPEDKRGGGGSHNWGSLDDPYSFVEPDKVEDYSENYEPIAPAEENVRMPDELADNFVKEMTLDEWKNLQDQNRTRPEFNLRKPVSSVPSKAVVIHKSKYKNYLEVEENQYVFRKPVNDITSQLDINFGSLPRPGRGGRGGGGGGRGRREEPFSHAAENLCAQSEDDANAPDPDDFEDFPALG